MLAAVRIAVAVILSKSRFDESCRMDYDSISSGHRVERASFPNFFPWRRDFVPGVHTPIILFFTTETRSTYIDLSEFVALAVASIQLNCFLFLASSYRQFARQRVSAEFRRRV
jgi:hypothetical protein